MRLAVHACICTAQVCMMVIYRCRPSNRWYSSKIQFYSRFSNISVLENSGSTTDQSKLRPLGRILLLRIPGLISTNVPWISLYLRKLLPYGFCRAVGSDYRRHLPLIRNHGSCDLLYDGLPSGLFLWQSVPLQIFYINQLFKCDISLRCSGVSFYFSALSSVLHIILLTAFLFGSIIVNCIQFINLADFITCKKRLGSY